MATLIITPETRYTPQESISTHRLVCAAPHCGATWDGDEDCDRYELIDGRAYCADSLGGRSCARNANAKAYRREAAIIVKEGIDEIVEKLADLAQDHPNFIDDPGHPLSMLSDTRKRLRAFADGKDNGWREDVMLDGAEYSALRTALRQALHLTSFETIPDSYAPEAPAEWALAGLVHQLRKLEAYNLRTTDGANQ